jgi:tRNA(Ile)-lysidine synthase
MLDRVTVERIEALPGPLLIALSGGGDSTALLYLVTERFGVSRVRAVVVDHALRAGSRDDALRAAGFADALGVEACVETLNWRDGERRNQEVARRKRYVALCERARVRGAGAILTGHTQDDQAETVLMRAAAGSWWRGLSGMAAIAPAPIWPEGRGLLVARPLLETGRDALRALLRSRGADWIEDPANGNPVFERVRVRQRLAALAGAGFDAGRLVALARRLRSLADAVDAGAAQLIEQAALIDEDIVISAAAWQGPDAVRARALSLLMAAAAGAEREPGAGVTAPIEGRFLKEEYRGETRSGVRFEPIPGGVRLGRDPGAALGRADGAAGLQPVELMEGQVICWDGRFALLARTSGCRAEPDPTGPRFFQVVGPGDGVQVTPLLNARVRHGLGECVLAAPNDGAFTRP